MGDIKTGGSNPWFNKTKVDQIKGISPTPSVSPPLSTPKTAPTSSPSPSKTSPPVKSVVSDEELSQLESGLDKIPTSDLVSKSKSIPSPKKLEEVSPPPEPTLSRCSKDLPDDLDVYPVPTGPSKPMISNRVLENLVQDGEINVVELMKLVPKDSENLFVSSYSISEGSKYQFIATDYRGREREVEIKFHSPDEGAYRKFGECNSSEFWTAQIRVDGRLLNSSGGLQYKSTDDTHIPLLFAPKED